MKILEIIKNRRSIRKFQKKKIPEEIIDKLIEAIIWAPSAGNLQSRKFYFVFDQKIKEELTKSSFGQSFIAQAPLVIVGCTNEKKSNRYGEKGRNLLSVCDIALSVQNLMLLAKEKGLGTCWVGGFNDKEISKILNLPNNSKPIVILPVGYPAEKPSPPPRISKEDAIKFIK
jgi:nitroreductase